MVTEATIENTSGSGGTHPYVFAAQSAAGAAASVVSVTSPIWYGNGALICQQSGLAPLQSAYPALDARIMANSSGNWIVPYEGLISMNSSGVLGINSSNQILAWGRFNAGGSSLMESFLLSPVPEPSTLLLLASGAIGLLAYAWRKRK
jgi:hypothetical protein